MHYLLSAADMKPDGVLVKQVLAFDSAVSLEANFEGAKRLFIARRERVCRAENYLVATVRESLAELRRVLLGL